MTGMCLMFKKGGARGAGGMIYLVAEPPCYRVCHMDGE